MNPGIPDACADIRPGMRGHTAEWGYIRVERVDMSGVTFVGSGGAGKPGTFTTTRSIIFAQCRWEDSR
jgi:hypothetical protein